MALISQVCFIYLFIYLFVYLFNYYHYLLKELGVEARRERDLSESLLDESPELLCGGSLWDPRNDHEQLESLCHARRSTCELMFEKVLILWEKKQGWGRARKHLRGCGKGAGRWSM